MVVLPLLDFVRLPVDVWSRDCLQVPGKMGDKVIHEAKTFREMSLQKKNKLLTSALNGKSDTTDPSSQHYKISTHAPFFCLFNNKPIKITH